MPFMTRLEDDLKAFFPRVDVVPGWQTRGSSSFAPAVVIAHWTAGPRGTTQRPSLNVCTNGRPGLAGPLCNVYLDKSGIPVIVAAGRANHAGAGSYKGVTGNSAAYGIEAESAGNNDWTAAQKAAYPRLIAAMLKGLGRTGDWTCGHNEWAPTRKIDINDWPMSAMRQQVTQILAEQEDDMFNDDDRGALKALFDNLTKEKEAQARIMGALSKENSTALNDLDGAYLVTILNRIETRLGALENKIK